MGDPGRLKQARSQVGDELIAGSALWNDRGGRGGPSVTWETVGSEGQRALQVDTERSIWERRPGGTSSCWRAGARAIYLDGCGSGAA